LGYDRDGWTYDTMVRDINQPGGSTRYGIVATPDWYRQVSRPGRLPLAAIWAPTPSQVTARGRELDEAQQAAKAARRFATTP
jgi:hypothetical protein